MSKLVLVTGSSKGIGAATIEEFASNGYDVIINYNTSESVALNLYNKIKEKYDINVYLEKFDITNELEVKNIFNKYKIDILINNAAISIDSNIEEKDKNSFMKVLEVNIFGTFLMIKTFIQSNKEGVIVNVSSTDAIDTYNILSIDYSASKAAILNITKNMANNYNSFKICAICPNWVNTEAIREMNEEYLESEMKRIGQKKLIEPSIVAKKIYDIVLKSQSLFFHTTYSQR